MNDLPRQKLCELIAKYGKSLCDEPGRCEAFLRDSCGQYRKEINALIDALKERIASELLNSSDSIPVELLIARLSKRLQDNRSITADDARWVVESWALALGKISAAQVMKPKSAAAVADALGLKSTSYATPPVIRATAATELPRKRKMAPILIGGSAALLIAGAISYYALQRPQRMSPQAGTTAQPEPSVSASPPQPTAATSPQVAAASPAVSVSPVTTPSIAPVRVGSVSVRTKPTGATVTIGDQSAKTPAKLDDLKIGKQTLRITLDGYEPLERKVEIKEKENVDLGESLLERAKKGNPADGRWVLQTPQRRETSGWTSDFDTAISISGKHAEYTCMKFNAMVRGGTPFHGASRVSYRMIEDCDAVSANGNIVSILWTNKRITDCNPSNLRASILDAETEWLQKKARWTYHLDGDKLISDRDQAVFHRAK